MKTFLTHLQERPTDALNPQFNYGGSSTGPGLDQYVPMADLNAQSEKEIKKSDLDQIEKYADRLFSSLDIDVEFTRHFLDRVNDERNVKQITPSELTRLFKQTYKKHGKTIARLGPDAQAVLTDMKTDINMPFVLNLKGGELELVAKTVMRKKNFKTSNPKLTFEDISEVRAKKAVAGGKVQKLVTAFGYSFKGKNYEEIDMELVGIDNSSQIVTFNIIHPAEIFGNEMKIPFRTLRRGRFMATDTSKINEDNPRIPRKKGQPAGSDKHSDLYTDENPKGTIHGLGFKDVATAKASVSKIEGSGKSHAHKIQAAIAMEQRAKVMGKKAEAAIYRSYINKMKKKTKQMQKEEFEFFPKKIYERINLPDPPNNLEEEIKKLKILMNSRTEEDEESIRNHDEHSFYAIDKYCEKHGLIFHDTEMKDIVDSARETIGYFKELFNYPRPFEVDKSIIPMGSKTNKTRSYPSGHACQSMLVGLYVSSKFPEHEKGVMEAAKECGMGRVLAGFHYVADYECGNLLANKMFLVMNRDNYGQNSKGE